MMTKTQKLGRLALTANLRTSSSILVGVLYLAATSVADAASGDGPVAGVIVDELNVLHPNRDEQDVIVTTACLEGNPFVPDDPPPELVATLSGCKLDIPAGSETPDNGQLIVVLPNNFGGLAVTTYGSGSNTAIETNVTVRAATKHIFFGLADPVLFDSTSQPSPDVDSTADVFCTSIDDGFDCAKVEPCTECPPLPASCGALDVEADTDNFCTALTGLLDGAYNLERNPLAYAIDTNMTQLATGGSVALKLCDGFQASCLPEDAPITANVRVTSTHTQAPFVETPRWSYNYR